MQPMYASGGRPTTFMDNTISGTPGGLMNMTQYGPFGQQTARMPDQTGYGGGVADVSQTAANHQGRGFEGYVYGLNGSPYNQLGTAAYLSRPADNAASFGQLQPV